MPSQETKQIIIISLFLTLIFSNNINNILTSKCCGKKGDIRSSSEKAVKWDNSEKIIVKKIKYCCTHALKI